MSTSANSAVRSTVQTMTLVFIVLFAITLAAFWFAVSTGAVDPKMIAGGILGMFGFSGILLVGMAHARGGKPVRKVEQYIQSISSGDYEATLDENLKGELDSLGNTAREMVRQFKERLGFSQGILEGLPIPTCVVDLDQRITFLNQECMDMMELNRKPEEYLGEKISQIFYKDDRDALILQSMQKLVKYHNRPAVFTTDTGREIDVLINMSPLMDLDGNAIGGFCMYLDITEIKERECQIVEQNTCITDAAEEAGSISDRLAVTAEQLSRAVRSAQEGAAVQRDRTTETATAMEEMNATVGEVAQHAVSAAESAEQAMEEAQEGSRAVTEVIEAINEVETNAETLKSSMEQLEQQAEEIGKVLNVIEDIADQTNLLALNAAIEAARAGEAGRGFAVVADEVRKLAEKTMQATAEVGGAIGSIQTGAQENVRATERAVQSVEKSTGLAHRSGEALGRIVAEADATADRVRSIAAAAEQQSAASEQINIATLDVSRISQETDDEMRSASSAVGELSHLAESLVGLIDSMNLQAPGEET